MNKQNKTLGLFLSLCIFLGTFSIIYSIHDNSNSSLLLDTQIQSADEVNPEDIILSLNGDIVSTDISVYRNIDVLNISLPEGQTGWSYEVNLTFSDASEATYVMVDPEADDSWEYLYTPSIDDIIGVTEIRILAYDAGLVLQDSDDVDGEFTIRNNAPRVGLKLNATELYRGATLDVEVMPSDIENDVSNLEWQLTLINEKLESPITLLTRGNSDLETEISILDSYSAGTWTINATSWDQDTLSDSGNSDYYTFEVLDNEPAFSVIDFINEDGEVMNKDSLRLARGETFLIAANVTDEDDSIDNLRLKLLADAPQEDDNNMFNSYSEIEPNYEEEEWFFYENITIPTDIGLGKVIFDVRLFENESTSIYSTRSFYLFITNNAPTVDSYKINDEVQGSEISVEYGEDITFTVNASDIEDNLEYIKIAIHYLNDDGEEEIIEYLKPYTGENTELIIRSVDIPSGSPTVYVYVYDADGNSGSAIPSYFVLKEEKQNVSMIWLMFAVGIIFGGALSVGLLNTGLKRRAERNALLKTETVSDVASKKKKVKKTVKTESDEPTSETEEKVEKSDKAPKKSKKKVVRRL